MSTHKADTVYTPGYTLCCWDGIIQEKETDLGYVHIVPDRFLLRTRIDVLLRCRNCSEAELIMSNELRCYVQINSVAEPNFK